MATPTYLKPEFSDLETCVGIVQNLHRNTGGDASFDEFSKIVGNSPTSSYFLLKSNAMRAYGLTEAKSERITITELGEMIAAPKGEDEFSKAVLEAISRFPVFIGLYDRYFGKAEPDPKYVENYLITEGKVKREKASAWAGCFLKSAKYAGLFKSKTLIEAVLSGPKVPQTFVLPGQAKTPGDETSDSDLSPSEAQQGWLKYPVPVPGGVARIIVPSDLSRPAWEKLKKLLEAIEPEKKEESSKSK